MSQSDRPSAFRVVTWNIHSCVGTDARFDPARTAHILRMLDADVVGLQEVGWHHRGERGIDQFAYLAEKAGYTAVPGPTKDHETAHYGNALLTRHPVLAVRPVDLSVPFREPRGAIDADLEVGGHKVRVVVAHLGLDPWERAAQVTRILDGLGQADGSPALLMGDLNEWQPDSPRIRRLRARLPEVAAPRSFHARLPTLRLDRIFVCPPLEIRQVEAVRGKLTKQASDHLPVRATIGWTAGA